MGEPVTEPTGSDNSEVVAGDDYGAIEFFSEETPAVEPEEPAEGDEPTEPAPVAEIEIPEIGKLSVAEIRELMGLKNEKDEIQKGKTELEKASQEFSTQAERLQAWRTLDEMAARYPKLRERVMEVIKTAAENGDLAVEAEGPGIEVDGLDGKARERDPDVQMAVEFAQRQMEVQAAGEIRQMVDSYAERFPGIVKPDQDWVSKVLAPAVIERFGEENVGLSQIRMTLNDLVMAQGPEKLAQVQGEDKVRRALSKQPPGTRVLPAGTGTGTPPAAATRKPEAKSLSWADLSKEAGQLLSG